MSGSRDTSTVYVLARTPSSVHCCAAAARSVAFISNSAMCAPWVAKRTASARPMPRPAPVITMVLSLIFMLAHLVLGSCSVSGAGGSGFAPPKADIMEAWIFDH